MKIHLVNSFCWFGFMIKDNKISKQKQKIEEKREKTQKAELKKTFHIDPMNFICICHVLLQFAHR